MANIKSNYTTYKILILGDSGAGKSALITKYVDNKFSSTFATTIGIDFKIKTIEENNIKLQIWDTGGQERFKTITKSYYRGSHGIVLVFDVCNADSYSKIEKWLSEISNETNRDISQLSIIIVGTKIDGIRIIEEKDARNYCSKNNIPYFETSSKTGVGVEDVFTTLISLVRKNNEGGILKATSKIKLNDKEESKNCCF